MSIRKYLCKKFDKENKGYVTLEDITDEVFTGESIMIIIFIIIIASVMTLFICLLGDIYNQGYVKDNRSLFDLVSLNNFMTGFLISGSVILILMILYKLWGFVKKFKVVVCPLKEKTQKEEI